MITDNVNVGDQVYWDKDSDDTGIVTEKNQSGILIDWDNGQLGWVDYRDTENIHPVKK